MKTLDEVIDDFEKACDLERRCENCSGCLGQENGCPNDGAESIPDALYYLKEFQGLSKMWNDKLDKEQENPPLTWQELKQMEGKPVWVEVDGKWWGRFWAFVGIGNDSYIDLFEKGQEYPEDLWKCNIGKTWQAYRRERQNVQP